jgi:hypothetical protein
VTSSNAERVPEWRPSSGHVPTEELARGQGVRPIASVDELARPDLFESDEELDESLALYASLELPIPGPEAGAGPGRTLHGTLVAASVRRWVSR